MGKESRNLWLDLGYETLRTEGPAGLTVGGLVKSSGLTKGSFYHHFADRDDYCHHLLGRWEVESTGRIIEMSNRPANPVDKIKELTRLTMALPGDLEQAIRTWARVEDLPAEYVKRIDGQRQKHIENLAFEKSGNRDKSRALARLLYAFFVGGPQIYPSVSNKEYKYIYSMIEELL